MFVMIISVAIGYGLTQIKKASRIVENEDMLYKSSMVLEDVLAVLQASPDVNRLADSNSSSELYLFFQMTDSLPFNIADEKVILSLKSANAKVNINSLNKKNEELFRDFFSRYMISNNYVDILKECMRKNQAKDKYNNYISSLFDKNPTLFRDYIASKEHLEQINRFYLQEYGDTNLKNIPFEELFSFKADSNSSVDLNYISSFGWELITGASQERAQELFAGEGSYNTMADLQLTPQERLNIAKFQTTFYAPYILVEIEILRDTNSVKIRFIYDIKSKRGYDFVFEV